MNNDHTPPEDRRDPNAPVTRTDLANVQRQLANGDLRMTAIEVELRTNTELTADVKALLEAVRAGLKVLGWLGSAAGWAAKVVTAVGAVYGAWQLIKHGAPPPK